eukprot:TRINITY_DN121260_c0_g1_i1.p2 TRINITY_DN121260_c0_g1~~TRINITY_DN121260_c0_g1_i1.p2  ORF type:complete len:520 (+),score=32.50 TRINITY_DN121260_c0_g1_i1:1891-3450(+)
MNNSSDDPEERDSMNSFGDYRPYSEGNRTRSIPADITQRTLPAPETRGEEDKENANSSSDTANFFQNSPTQNLSFDNDFIAPQNPLRLTSSPHIPYEERPWENRNESSGSVSVSVSDYGSITRSTRTQDIFPLGFNPSTTSSIPLRGLDQENGRRFSQSGDDPNERPRIAFEEQVEEILDDIVYLSNKERDRLKECKTILKEQSLSFEEFVINEQERVKVDKKLWEDNLRKAVQLFTPAKEIVELNIGGTHKLVSTKATLCKAQGSALAAMFSGKHKLKTHKGRVFIDRDGEAFCMVLSYLRNNKLPLFANKAQENLFYEELDYWQIPLVLPHIDLPEFDSLWCAPTLRLEHNNMVVRKHGPQHGVVFCKFPLSGSRRYVEFRVTVNIPIRSQKSSLFIGLVDKLQYQPEQLVSTFWRDSPSSFYCDIWNGKLIKIDERGRQVGMVAGYGCECQDADVNILGMMYDEQKETLSYYKNGICLGIGFHNVPKGLYPAVDLWFESGNVEILNKSQPSVKEPL